MTNNKASNLIETHSQVMLERELRVLLITSGVSRLVEPLINSRHTVVGFLESAPRHYKSRPHIYKLQKLARLIFSKATGRELSLKNQAEKLAIPYKFMTSSDEDGLPEWLEELHLDIIVVFSMSQLLKEKIFKIPKFGTINLHAAFLPEYRGPNPDFWQYYDMEMNPGVTVHYINKGEDTGDIIFQERIHVPLGTKSPQRLDMLIGETGVSLVLKALDAIKEGSAPRVKQSLNSPSCRARNLTTEEHKSIIDWHNWPIERIWHILRGTELWLDALPQPKGLWKGQRWTIGNYEKQTKQFGRIGEIHKQNGQHFISCAEGRIFLSLRFSFKNLVISLFKSNNG